MNQVKNPCGERDEVADLTPPNASDANGEKEGGRRTMDANHDAFPIGIPTRASQSEMHKCTPIFLVLSRVRERLRPYPFLNGQKRDKGPPDPGCYAAKSPRARDGRKTQKRPPIFSPLSRVHDRLRVGPV